MTSRAQTTDNLNDCYDEIEALMAGLQPQDWDVQSLCPDWTVRGVIAHLASVEHAISGWLPTDDDTTPPFDKVGAFLASADAMTSAEFTAAVTSTFATRRADLAQTTDEDFARASMTPVGPGTYQRLMDVRVFDFWVHHRDIAGPLGLTTSDGGGSAETAVDEVHGSMGYIAGKKIGLPDKMSLAVRLTGPVTRDLFVAVDGRAGVVDHLDDPTVELETDSVTFVQLACGRIDPRAAIEAGKITWKGDPEWGEKAALNLAFTM